MRGRAMPLTAAQSFRPGDELAKYLTITMPPPDAPVDVHGNQVQALEHSKCFTSGQADVLDVPQRAREAAGRGVVLGALFDVPQRAGVSAV